MAAFPLMACPITLEAQFLLSPRRLIHCLTRWKYENLQHRHRFEVIRRRYSFGWWGAPLVSTDSGKRPWNCPVLRSMVLKTAFFTL
jgi:hypothetical protein